MNGISELAAAARARNDEANARKNAKVTAPLNEQIAALSEEVKRLRAENAKLKAKNAKGAK